MLPDCCGSCFKTIHNNKKVFPCNICKTFTHFKCSLLTSDESTYNAAERYCSKCIQTIFPFNHINDETEFILALKELQSGCSFDFDPYKDLNFNPLSVDFSDSINIDPDIHFYSKNIPLSSKSEYTTEADFHARFSDKKDHFSLIHFNARSLSQNSDSISSYLHALKHKFSIIGISETWLSDETSSQYNIEDYNFLSCNRNDRQGGGVGLYINNQLNFTRLTDIEINDDNICQSIFIEIKLDQRNIIVGIIYRPPNSNQNSFLDYIENTLNKTNNPSKLMYILGDININLFNTEICSITNDYYQTMTSYSFYPTILKPTRITNHTATLIDHCFTNDMEHTLYSGILVTDISDHLPIFLIINLTIPPLNHNYFKTRVFNQNNIKNFVDSLNSMDWTSVYMDNDPDSSYNTFHVNYTKLYNENFPFKNLKRSHQPKKPWITPSIIRSIAKKNQLYKKYLHKKTSASEKKYKTYRNKLNNILRISKKNYYAFKIDSAKNDLKSTWKIIRELTNKSKANLNYPNSFLHNNNELSEPTKIAETFNKYFLNVGPDLASKIDKPTDDFTTFLSGDYSQSFLFLPTNDMEIKNLISAINPSKSPGPDQISPSIVKHSAIHIAPLLTHIFNKSLETGIVPSKLKTSKVIPLFKADNPKVFSNYRPISLLPIFSKILEKLVYNRLTNYIDKYNILTNNQYGFRKNYSTYMALIELFDKLSLSFDTKEFTIGIFIDLSKAFDTVNHEILLKKLYHYGIRGIPYFWFKSYLSNRKQFVQLNDTSSSPGLITCGVPQGSILGPLLFLLYINDISNCTNILNFTLFADDTSILASDKDLPTLINRTNLELSKLSTWFKANKLSLNLKKTKLIIFCPKNKQYPRTTIDIMIDNKKIEQVDSIKFLGVLIHENLNWKPHINLIALKISKSIGVINKIKFFIPIHIRISLYNTLILPYLQYCNIVWAKTYPTNLDKLYKLQKRIIRIISNSGYRDHTLPLFYKFKILSIYDINKHQTGTFMFKYFNRRNLLPPYFKDYFILNKEVHGYNTRNANKIHLEKARTTARQFSLKYYGPVYWNSLNPSLIETSSISIFKHNLKQSLLKYPCHDI